MLELFLGGLVATVPKIVGNWLETRNAIRVEYVKAHMNTLAEERKVQTALRLREIDRERQQDAGYPFGVPGRLRTLLPGSGLPTIILSPPPPGAPGYVAGVEERIRELLAEVPGFDAYAVVPSGVFARDNGVPRFIDGEIGARAVAAEEFGKRPAVLAYFDTGGRTFSAHAYLSTIFGTGDGQPGLPFLIAKYRPGSGDSSRRDADLPSWHFVDPFATPHADPVDVVAMTVCWFLVSVVDTYWQHTAGLAPGLLGLAGAEAPAELPAAPDPAPVTEKSQLARVESESARLVELGYAVTAEPIDGGYLGLHLTGPADVVFVVDESYPELPPVVIRLGDTDVHIDAADWTAECTLADIVEAMA
ncbi:MAG TPA: hypothetical protein VG497_06620 [Kribbella sp.]|nr:hypothetical protein [Kribbella sp.]